ncbi:MAG: flavodoxin family protein [Deltaproteobacteria bacterium]|nr:flavodoxin family protein [Deltaproteobacteria bacterium]
MKITCVLGSPRSDGVSTAVARQFCATGEEVGAHAELFTLSRLRYRGCQGCLQCKTRLDRCVLEDDLTAVLDATRQADVLLLATPVYCGDLSSQAKGFVDRCFSFLKPDYLTSSVPHRLAPGKRLVFVQAQGFPEQVHGDLFPRYAAQLRWLGFEDPRLIRVCAPQAPGLPAARERWMQQARETALAACRTG